MHKSNMDETPDPGPTGRTGFLRERRFMTALLVPALFAGIYLAFHERAPALAWIVDMPLFFASRVLLWPVLEELVFRGAIQGWLRRNPGSRRTLAGVSGANLLTSLLFGALHLVYHPWHQALAVIAPSLVFGYFRDRHGSTLPGMVLHSLYNLGFFMVLPPAPAA